MSLGAIDFGLIVDGAVIIVENAVRRLSEAQRDAGRRAVDATSASRSCDAATLEVRSRERVRRGDHRDRLPADPRADGDRGQAVPADGDDGAPRARRRVRPLAHARAGAHQLPRRAARGEHETWLLRHGARGCTRRCSLESLRPVAHRRARGARARRRACALVSRLGAEFVPQLDEGDLARRGRRLPGIALTESVATRLRLETRAAARSPRSRIVVSRTGAPEIATDPMGVEQTRRLRRAQAASDWRTGLTPKADSPRRSPSATRARRPRDRRRRFAADPDAHQRAGRGRALRRRRHRLRPRSRRSSASSATRSRRGARARPGRGRRARRAGRRASDTCAIAPDRDKLARYGLDDRGRESGHARHRGRPLGRRRARGRAALRHRRSRSRHGFARRPRALRALPLRSVSGQIVPLGDVAELELVDGPGADQPRDSRAALTVEFNVRGRDLGLGRQRRAADAGDARCRCPRLPHRVGRAVRALSPTRRRGCSSSCRSRSR